MDDREVWYFIFCCIWFDCFSLSRVSDCLFSCQLCQTVVYLLFDSRALRMCLTLCLRELCDTRIGRLVSLSFVPYVLPLLQ